MKVTAVAPANLAVVKYWGARDLSRGVPHHPSISLTMTRCRSRCTVEARGTGEDEVLRSDSRGELRPAAEAFAAPVRRQVERLRRAADDAPPLRIATHNTFPTGAGLASSASGFAALTLAAGRAFGLDFSAAELSVWARRSGSGSAARSALGGYVEWPSAASDSLEAPARQLAPPTHWDLRDLVAVVDETSKAVSSREGHRRAASSPHFGKRLELVPGRLEKARTAVRERDLGLLGEVLEREAVELHLIAMSSRPPVFYWSPATLSVLEAVRGLRADEGVEAYFSVDAGPNVHVVCGPEAEERVERRLQELPGVDRVIGDRVGPGPSVDEEHLL